MVKESRRYAEFLKGLSAKKTLPVYLFTGTNDFLKREGLRKLSHGLLSPEAKFLNYESFVGGDCDWSDVEVACASSGLFSEKKVVALIGVELMSSGDVSGFCEYVRRPCESTCLVAMTCSFGEEHHRRGGVSLRRILGVAGELPGAYVFWKGYAPDCRAWAHEWLRDNGRRMTDSVLFPLLESLGNSSYEVWNVLEKAASLAGGRVDITGGDVEFVGGAASLGSVEAFRTAVAVGDRVAAHRNAEKCLKARVQSTTLLWRLNALLREGVGATRSPGGRDANKKEKWVRDAFARRLSTKQMCQAIAFLCETEKGIKTGALGPELAVEMLINELTR